MTLIILFRNYESNDKNLYRNYESIFSQWISFEEFVESNLLFLGETKGEMFDSNGANVQKYENKREKEEDEIYNLNVNC